MLDWKPNKRLDVKETLLKCRIDFDTAQTERLKRLNNKQGRIFGMISKWIIDKTLRLCQQGDH